MAVTIDELQIEIQAKAGTASKGVDELVGSLSQLSSAVKKNFNLPEIPKQMGEMAKAARTADAAVRKNASGLSKFASSLKRIMMYRVVRSILSNISSAAKDGIQNLAQYSRAIGGIDSSRANATMSQLATTGLQLKNAFGAALMPVLNALMPVIQTLANWFIIAANAVNQFFAAISGASMWTKAKEYAADYAGGLGQAAGAASDLKNAMLGIDELNVISPNSGGGGGGGGASNFAEMFEEVEINAGFRQLLKDIETFFAGVWGKIKETGAIDRLTEAWDRLKDALGNLWESPAMQSIISWLKSAFEWALALAGVLVIDALAGVVNILADIANLIDAIISGDIAGVINGIKDTLVDIVALPLGLVADVIDAIFGTDVRGWLDGVVEAVKNFDLAAWFVQTWEDIKSAWQNAPNWFDENVVQPVVGLFSGLWQDIKSIYEAVANWFQTNVITPVSTAFNTVTTAIGGFFTNLWTGIKTTFESVANWFKTNVTDPIGNFFKGAINIVIDALNALIRGLNKISVTVPDWVADLLGMAKGSTFGFNISTIPRLAEGGFVDSGQLFMARENGLTEMVGAIGNKAAVANNDQIVEAVSAGVYRAVSAAMAGGGGSDAPVVVYLDGDVVYTNQEKVRERRGYPVGMNPSFGR